MEFEFQFLETITDNFSDEHKVGSVEDGDVYKGAYNGEDIAVIRLHPLKGVDDKVFVNECRRLSMVHHQNLVRLIGYCCESRHGLVKNKRKLVMERLLCYEYMHGGSLDKQISDEPCDLDWPICYEIIKGICEGLNHLHNADEGPFYHLDLKPANILLDKNMTAKISDFGLIDLHSTGIRFAVGFTFGFVRGFIPAFIDGFIDGFRKGRGGYDPETHGTEIPQGKHEYVPLKAKIDVSDLGVTIIKMMAGNKGYSCYRKKSADDFTELVSAKWNKKLQGTPSYLDILLVQTCVRIALRCVATDQRRRPSINEIISTLKSKEAWIKQISLSSDRSKDLLARMEDMHIEFDMLECIVGGSQNPRSLKLPFLRFITEDFSDELKIGSGGCGVVYKGVMRNGIIAVKKLSNKHTMDDKMFHGEVKTLMAVNHENVVRFLGYCSHTEEQAQPCKGRTVMAEVRERLLCFEYISNGSLQNKLTDELRGLEWQTRYQIIRGICDGLDHLHREKHIIHMDLKPANILLDNNMVPKITDFGLSRFDDISQTKTSDRLLSLGYCAPEYLDHGKMSSKSDIYSLGHIVLALLTGSKKKPDISKVHRRWKHRWNRSAKDAQLLWYKQMAACLDVAQRCTRMDPIDRPNVWDIISDLNKMDSSSVVDISDDDHEYLELQDMLGIKPLQIHLPLELNKQVSRSVELTNDTDDHFAFRISTTSLRPYCIEENIGTISPRSTRSVTITLRPLGRAQPDDYCRDEFSVQSTRVDGIVTAMDIDGGIFREEPGKVVDTVDLTVILSDASPSF